MLMSRVICVFLSLFVYFSTVCNAAAQGEISPTTKKVKQALLLQNELRLQKMKRYRDTGMGITIAGLVVGAVTPLAAWMFVQQNDTIPTAVTGLVGIVALGGLVTVVMVAGGGVMWGVGNKKMGEYEKKARIFREVSFFPSSSVIHAKERKELFLVFR